MAVSDWDEQKSVIDLREAAREALMVRELEKMRNDDHLLVLEAMTADGNIQVSYGAASAAQRNTWMVNNADRVLFGNSTSNAVSKASWRPRWRRSPPRPAQDDGGDRDAGQAHSRAHRQPTHPAFPDQRQ